ncbi:hypothetical protein BDV06DRAFT_80634 [Aspergillus oleicola]
MRPRSADCACRGETATVDMCTRKPPESNRAEVFAFSSVPFLSLPRQTPGRDSWSLLRFTPRFALPQPISTTSCTFLSTLIRLAIGLTYNVINSQLNQSHLRLAYAPVLFILSLFQLTAIYLYVRRIEAFNGQ